MVNQVCDDMEGWIDDEVEVIPEDEKVAQKSSLDAKENLDEARQEQKMRQKSHKCRFMTRKGGVKTLQCEH
jgi:hypothetical protein